MSILQYVSPSVSYHLSLRTLFCLFLVAVLHIHMVYVVDIKETRSVTMNIFRKKYFLFKSFVKIELSYVFTINIFSKAESFMEQ